MKIDPKQEKQLRDFVNEIKASYLGTRNEKYLSLCTTLGINPLLSVFPNQFLCNKKNEIHETILFIKKTARFYVKSILSLLRYCLYKAIAKTQIKGKSTSNSKLVFDIFIFADASLKSKKILDKNFGNLYDVLSEENQNYQILTRIYQPSFSIKKFMQLSKLFNENRELYLLEYDFFHILDTPKYLWMTFVIPFKFWSFRRPSKEKINRDFNSSLWIDMGQFDFYSLIRFFIGHNISRLNNVEKIYSWCEHQPLEKTFNYNLHKNSKITVHGCQLFINSPEYLNTHIDDLDFLIGMSPDVVLVNGPHYILQRNKIKYKNGVSLRYSSLFDTSVKHFSRTDGILVLGSIKIDETREMIKKAKKSGLDFKVRLHPVVGIENYNGLISEKDLANGDMYELFKTYSVVLTGGTGAAVEAVVCGVSVIILERLDGITINPLSQKGEGVIWSQVSPHQDLKPIIESLSTNRNNLDNIQEISKWYLENYFIPPNKENIVRAFLT